MFSVYKKAFISLLQICVAGVVFAEPSSVTSPVIGSSQFIVTNIATENVAAADCSVYNKLLNQTILVTIPASMHSAQVLPIYVGNNKVMVSSDNGWGPPYYLYGSNISVLGVNMVQFFVEFKDNSYTRATQLVMRAAPLNPSSPTSFSGFCRITASAG